jgi:hypothetical protein
MGVIIDYFDSNVIMIFHYYLWQNRLGKYKINDKNNEIRRQRQTWGQILANVIDYITIIL